MEKIYCMGGFRWASHNAVDVGDSWPGLGEVLLPDTDGSNNIDGAAQRGCSNCCGREIDIAII